MSNTLKSSFHVFLLEKVHSGTEKFQHILKEITTAPSASIDDAKKWMNESSESIISTQAEYVILEVFQKS
jgi:hypothetical protein